MKILGHFWHYIGRGEIQGRGLTNTFIGLEDNPIYWREFHLGSESDLSTKVFCEDFADYSGLLVPQLVRITKPTRIDGEIVQYPIKILTLIDAEVNEECEFVEGYFEGAALPFTEGARLEDYRILERTSSE